MRRGFTLIEVLIAVSLVGLISLAMMISIRVGLNAQSKAETRLFDNRRVMGAQRALEQELNGFMPEVAVLTSEQSLRRVPFFDGQPGAMRLISSYSLNGASRGNPQILEFLVIPGERGEGVRLIVNELPYLGPASAGARIAGFETDKNGLSHALFQSMGIGPGSFVLADRLAYCRMQYLEKIAGPDGRLEWRQDWPLRLWPVAVRIAMAPLETDPSHLHPITVTAALHAFRDPDLQYGDVLP